VTRLATTLALLCLALPASATAEAVIPIRISVKVILDESGSRADPPGPFTRDEDIRARFDWANGILADQASEFRLELVEIRDLPGQSGYFHASVDDLQTDLVDEIHTAARLEETAWLWRDDAINVYVTGVPGGGISGGHHRPILVMGQSGSWKLLLHEVGHNLSLQHTSVEDFCSDTLADDPSWDHGRVARENFGQEYDQLAPNQQALVDQTYYNVMSISHGDQVSNRLTPCQLRKMRGMTDLTWYVSRVPVYVDDDVTQGTGHWPFPYPDLHVAVATEDLSGKTVILDAGSYLLDAPLEVTDLEITTFGGPSTLGALE
jgi:hypothetical protein